jgi:predicted RNA-binding Zn ribbon-like protein
VDLSSYAELAVRLANSAATADREPDCLGSTVTCAQTFSDCISGPVTRRDLAVLQHLRTEFAAIFTLAASGDEKASMSRLNALLIQFPIQPEMVSHDDQRWHVHLAAQGAVSDRFAAGAIIGLALTVSQHGPGRLRVCTIASCPRVYVDSSPNRSRRYCTEHTAAPANVSTLPRQAASDTRDATPAAS